MRNVAWIVLQISSLAPFASPLILLFCNTAIFARFESDLDKRSDVVQLINMLDECDEIRQKKAILRICLYGSRANSTVPALIRIVKNKKSSNRIIAIKAIGAIGDISYSDTLLDMYDRLTRDEADLDHEMIATFDNYGNNRHSAAYLYSRALVLGKNSGRLTILGQFGLVKLGNDSIPFLVSIAVSGDVLSMRLHSLSLLIHVVREPEPNDNSVFQIAASYIPLYGQRGFQGIIFLI